MKLHKGSQNERLLHYLMSGAVINQPLALNRLGISRLAARIYDLRGFGWQIKDCESTWTGPFGNTEITKYWLEDNQHNKKLIEDFKKHGKL